MSDKISYCGFNCLKCNAYKPDEKKDLKKGIKFQNEGNKTICHGCKTTKETLSIDIAECEIRFCANDKNLLNCAYCALYPCEKIDFIISRKKSSNFFSLSNK